QRKIGEGTPDSIRARNRRVPVDVETVCLVAMDKDPSRRYASAAELARDLASLLAPRTIEARPPSTGLRLTRWAQRRPAVATGILLGALLLVGTPSALYFQAREHNAQ